MTTRDTYKYHLRLQGKIVFVDVTSDLVRREQEHKARHPDSQIEQVGRRTTRKAALRWLEKQRKVKEER